MNYIKKIIYCKNKKNQKIYGEAFIPNSKEKFPLIIFSHGYGYNGSFIDEERLASNGISVYKFDFCGGSNHSRSEGKSTEMSVMTEVDDLECVLDQIKKQDFVDENKIYLSGCSQGGLVTLIVGEKKQDELKGLILYCAGLAILDYYEPHMKTKNKTESFRLINMMITRKYFDDIINLDVYKTIENIKIPFLYYHGDKDECVSVNYAYQAKKYFNDKGKLIILKNASHMLCFGNEDRLFSDIINFIKKNQL